MTKWMPDLDDREPPIYRALADAIEEAVARGELSPGDQLPTQRALARSLQVTVGTVSRAYQEAEGRGLLSGQVGRGTFVQPPPSDSERWIRGAGTSDEGEIDLSANFPPPVSGDGPALSSALQEIAGERDAAWLLRYRKTALAPPGHRRAGASWLKQRGLEVPPERVLVSAGAQHALTAAFAALTRPNDLVLCGTATYPGFRTIARMFAVEVEGVAMDEEGILPDELDSRCRSPDVKILYALPTLQNPTVATMSERRRRQVAEICSAHDVLIVEDDIYAPLLPDAPSPIAHHAPDTVCYISSLSKAVAPGLRVAYVVAPHPQAARIEDGIRATMWMPPPLCLEVVSRWIESGRMDDLIERRRACLSERNRLAAETLGPFEYRSHEHSMHLWLSLPGPWTGREFAAAALERGVRVTEPEVFAVDPHEVPAAVRVCLGAPEEDGRLARALQTIRALLDEGPSPTLSTV